MTRQIAFVDGRHIVDGVDVWPPQPLTATGKQPSMLRFAAAARSYRELVARHEVDIMAAKVRSCRRGASARERDYRTPEYMRSLEIVLKAQGLYNAIFADCAPADLDTRAFKAEMSARTDAQLVAFGFRPRNQQAGGAELGGLVRSAFIDIARELTFAALRALQVADRWPAYTWAEQHDRAVLRNAVSTFAGLWHAALST
jgi:hypothetical protein